MPGAVVRITWDDVWSGDSAWPQAFWMLHYMSNFIGEAATRVCCAVPVPLWWRQADPDLPHTVVHSCYGGLWGARQVPGTEGSDQGDYNCFLAIWCCYTFVFIFQCFYWTARFPLVLSSFVSTFSVAECFFFMASCCFWMQHPPISLRMWFELFFLLYCLCSFPLLSFSFCSGVWWSRTASCI